MIIPSLFSPLVDGTEYLVRLGYAEKYPIEVYRLDESSSTSSDFTLIVPLHF